MRSYLINQQDSLKEAAMLVLQGKHVSLTAPMQEKLNRAKFAHDQALLLRQIKTPPWKIRNAIANAISENYGISLSVAYRVYQDACTLFGVDEPINTKELSYKLLFEEIDDALEAARQEGEHKAVAALIKTKYDAIKNMPDFDRSRVAELPFATIRYDFSPEQLKTQVMKSPKQLDDLEAKLLRSLTSGKSAQNIKQEMIETLEEAEYEDITND